MAASDSQPDHSSYRGLPSIGYAVTQRRRVAAGWEALAGNHVFIDRSGVVLALSHLRQGSLRVGVGQQVRAGEPVAECGNTGNSTEPHVHVQALDSPDIARANAVQLTFGGTLPRNGEIVDLPER